MQRAGRAEQPSELAKPFWASLSRRVFAGILARINGLRGPPAEAACA
jgi:hypothetical protein